MAAKKPKPPKPIKLSNHVMRADVFCKNLRPGIANVLLDEVNTGLWPMVVNTKMTGAQATALVMNMLNDLRTGSVKKRSYSWGRGKAMVTRIFFFRPCEDVLKVANVLLRQKPDKRVYPGEQASRRL